jgi:prepilin-type processing-associated H-X9-DG protein
MYANDFDETMPLSTSNIDGRWLWNFRHMSPPNWSSSSHPAITGSRFVWPNSSQEYGITDEDLTCPNHQAVRVQSARFTYDTPLARPIGVSYAMNGLLNAYKLADITNKALVPMVWEGRGRAKLLGGVIQNPFLHCDDGTQPCTFNTSCSRSTNGGTGSAFGLDASVWTHGKQNNWLFVDGHVEGRKMGAVLSPENTDRSLDLYTGYSAVGVPGFIWIPDGCHPVVFKPNP